MPTTVNYRTSIYQLIHTSAQLFNGSVVITVRRGMNKELLSALPNFIANCHVQDTNHRPKYPFVHEEATPSSQLTPSQRLPYVHHAQGNEEENKNP